MIIDNESLWAIGGTIIGAYGGWFFTHNYYKNKGFKPFWKKAKVSGSQKTERSKE